jgi:GH25 family lysozyme M1 (1,4-beta-N-acetylmuramidase)
VNSIVPPGCKLLQQSQVTADMTAWAVALLGDVAHYPMFAFAVKAFGTAQILAHIEWHPPDGNNGAVHRGVTLYAIPVIPPEGIDVSGFQPTVNWPKVAAGGKVFAFIKATEGTALVDSQFARHWAGAKSVGILRGAYHFLRPELDAVAQAKHLLAQLAADPGELPPVCDVEVSDNVPLAQVAACVASWMDYVGKNFGRSILYTMPGFWDTLPTQNLQMSVDLWVAHWGVARPTVPRGWPSWQFWQYTNKATVSGIPGSADMDDDRYNGSYFDLLAYSAAALRPAPSVLSTLQAAIAAKDSP